MTVAELRKALEGVPDDARVVVGNPPRYSFAHSVSGFLWFRDDPADYFSGALEGEGPPKGDFTTRYVKVI